MKPIFIHHRPIRPVLVLLAGCALAVAAGTARAEAKVPAKTNKANKADATTNAAPAAIVIAKSEFAVPTSAAQGRDPFFPHSSRLGPIRPKPGGGTEPGPGTPAIALVLQGISGTDAKRFALISRRTFEAGEEGDVTVGRTKVHVRCITIKEDSVLIEVDGKPQELRLRPGI